MPVRKNTIKAFLSGTHNRFDDEDLPKDAASDSLGWLTKDGRAELMYGRQTLGGAGSAGKNRGQHIGYTVAGTAVHFRKIWDNTEGKIQTLVGSTWTDVVTGLANSDMIFTNYSSLAGNFVFCTSPEDGIYKIVTANPTSSANMYSSSKNFKGYGAIDRGRMRMWGVENDPTGLYGSYIDGQDSGVYTTVASEALAAVESGTLAFKAGGATRNCFGVAITDTSSGEVFTDNYDGTLTGDSGGSGTINYMSGVFTITGQTGAGTADYQWEDSNASGVTDFTKSATRTAGQGFVVRQDAGGDAIKVVLPYEGAYFSFKERSVYQFTPDLDDLTPKNELIRTDIGIDTLRGAVSTSRGIVFLDTANPTEPTLSVLHRNLNGDNFTTTELFPQFKFSLFGYADVAIDTWDEYILVGCTQGTTDNNRLLLCNMRKDTVDIAPYAVRNFSKTGGFLYGGDPVSQTTYELFTGFDDLSTKVENEWISMGDTMGSDVLKRVKKMRFRGLIDKAQKLGVYVSAENGDWQKVGTILGTGDYVDYSSSYAIGTSFIGAEVIGGGTVPVYSFLLEMKVKYGRFRKRQVKLIAEEYGYVAIDMMEDFDVWTYSDKIPVSYRLKQNVTIDGASTDQADPDY